MPPHDFEGQFAWLLHTVAEMQRRDRNRKRTGVVSEVDLKKGLARVELAAPEGGSKYLSPWLPWKEIAAGGIKSHIPPTVGEQVDVLSESGDLTDAIIDMSTPSSQNPRPHDGPEAVITKGRSRVTIADDTVTIATGTLKIAAAVEITGSKVTHNGHSIGDDHKHTEVERGTDLSGPPQ